MKTVAVPSSFFVSERNSIYGDWRSAFWRELISNSLDAGANSILIRTRFNEGGRLIVDIVDNGCGMTRETVEEVYMRLGASTKGGGEATVGGFGRARILTCFSQDHYRIRTADITVIGEGASYEIREAGAHVRGTAITIGVSDPHPGNLYRGLRRVLKQSSLRAAISLDLAEATPEGEPLSHFDDDLAPRDPQTGRRRFRGWSRKGRRFGELADETGLWGVLHVSEGVTAQKRKAVVRVNGMAMYDEHISASVQVTVDLDPARAREVLTASRDSIRGEFRQELQKVFNRIAADRTSTFRERGAEPVLKFARGGGGTEGSVIRHRHRRQADTPLSGQAPVPVARARDEARAEVAEPRDLSEIRERAGERRERILQTRTTADGWITTDALRLSVLTFVDNPNAAQRAASSRYMGETWAAAGAEGRNAELLHAAWTAACRHALEILVESYPALEGERWATGFLFDQKCRGGMHKSFGEVRHGLLLNPVDEGGRMRFRLSDPGSMKEMIAVAVHEAVHCVHDWHDEDYANTLTSLFGKIRDRDIEREIRDELEEARAWIAERERERVHRIAEVRPAEEASAPSP
ncbi:ATP-binding protein [Defluviimonas salinarum]|uniref:ATP-binding protein n=1 Tax=Defluviimonas salinarum TaxID=2992147 RepID=A0ABT3J8B1_9RHOB|nr:ATP-binding protein [Defluviimonas salinarum]MCW3783928.1 ATP-binding protein [Defluviimonas salinarum]